MDNLPVLIVYFPPAQTAQTRNIDAAIVKDTGLCIKPRQYFMLAPTLGAPAARLILAQSDT